MVSCRICKGDHWTTKCPFKDSVKVADLDDAKGVQLLINVTLVVFMYAHTAQAMQLQLPTVTNQSLGVLQLLNTFRLV